MFKFNFNIFDFNQHQQHFNNSYKPCDNWLTCRAQAMG